MSPGKRRSSHEVSNTRLRLHGLDERIIPGIAEKGLSSAKGEDFVAQTKVITPWGHIVLGRYKILNPLNPARCVDQGFHGLKIKKEAPLHVGMLGIGSHTADYGREHQVVASNNLGGAVVLLTVAVPVPVIEKPADLVVFLPRLWHSQLLTGFFFVLGPQFRVIDYVGTVFQIMAITVHGKLDHLTLPGGHVFIVTSDLLHLGHVDIFLWNWRKIGIKVTYPE